MLVQGVAGGRSSQRDDLFFMRKSLRIRHVVDGGRCGGPVVARGQPMCSGVRLVLTCAARRLSCGLPEREVACLVGLCGPPARG